MGWPIDPDHPLVPDAGFWYMPEGSGNIIQDLSGKNNGTFVNTTYWTAGKFGPCIGMDDDNSDYITMGDVLNDLSFPVSVSFWVKVANTDIFCVFHTDNNFMAGADAYRGLMAQVQTGKIYATYGDNTGLAQGDRRSVETDNVCITTGQWHYVVIIVRAATDWSIYVDSVSQPVSYSGTGGAMVQTSDAFTLGSLSTTITCYAHGELDIFSFYNNRDLSAYEIALLYSNSFVFIEPSWNWVLWGGISAPAAGAPQVIFIN